MSDQPAVGTVGWMDLTIPDATRVRDFYTQVAGWTTEPIRMGDYDDYVMKSPETGAPVAGICHQRGSNAALPPVWLIYIVVADIDASLERCLALGGKSVTEVKSYGGASRYVVIQDPAGAFAALFQAG